MEDETAETSNISESAISEMKTRLGPCEVCGSPKAIYTCPRCEVKTCCLKCSKIHKMELDCNGERDRTKYIPLKKFTNFDLSSDYRLMEEISRNMELTKKNFGKRMKYDIPFHLIKLRNGAAARNTTLKFLPSTFERHKNNTTSFDAKKNLIHWRLDWIFMNAVNLCLSDSNVSEGAKLNSILTKYLKEQEDAILQEKLQFYQSAGNMGIRVFLKAERRKGDKYYECDTTTTLKECLVNRTVIEYPTFVVILKNHECPFEIIDSDYEDEDEIEINHGGLKHKNNKRGRDNKSKNLLFASEYSDEELSD